jgi:uncharacterized Zn finger protein
MAERERPDFIYYECPDCDDVTEHDILKARMGKDNITGTFRCRDCGRTFSDSIKIPRQFEIPVLFSDGEVTEKTQTQLEDDEIISVGDEFYLDDGRRVCVTYLDLGDERRKEKARATEIKKLWVKQFDVLSVKVSVNDNRRTIPLRIDAEPDDEFAVGMVMSFEDYDAVIHAIKTKTRLVRKGSAEAREIRRIYAKIRPKNFAVMDFEDEEFDESQYYIPGEEDDDSDI